MRRLLAPWLLAALLLPAAASAQDGEPEPPTADEGDPGEAPLEPPGTAPPDPEVQPADAPREDGALPPALPAPTLPDAEPIAPPEPTPAAEEEPGPDPAVLYRISAEDEPPPEPDVGFETPGDLRTESSVQGQVPEILRGPPRRREPRDPDADPEDEPVAPEEKLPPPFALALGAGWSRLLAVEAVDYVRLEQRFEVRVPDFEALRIGAGVAEMISPDERYLIEGGVRVAFGFFFCHESWIRCEGTIAVQPGVIGGTGLGASFDLNAGLDLRFLIEEALEVSLGAAYSLVGTTSLIHTAGMLGLVF